MTAPRSPGPLRICAALVTSLAAGLLLYQLVLAPTDGWADEPPPPPAPDVVRSDGIGTASRPSSGAPARSARHARAARPARLLPKMMPIDKLGGY